MSDSNIPEFGELINELPHVPHFLLKKNTVAYEAVQRAYAKYVSIIRANPRLFPHVISDIDRNKYIKEILLLMSFAHVAI